MTQKNPQNPPFGRLVKLSSGYEIHYTEQGQGPAVVFVHGSGPGANAYSNFFPNIGPISAAGYRCILPDMIGFGFNAVTGDFSRGASGWWIEDGKLAFPVEEVTIAGNFRDMLRGIEMIGDDLRFRGPLAAPTIKIDRMMVSGE